jgi:hypothetical protein
LPADKHFLTIVPTVNLPIWFPTWTTSYRQESITFWIKTDNTAIRFAETGWYAVSAGDHRYVYWRDITLSLCGQKALGDEHR